jgi:hypothetical protein
MTMLSRELRTLSPLLQRGEGGTSEAKGRVRGNLPSVQYFK